MRCLRCGYCCHQYMVVIVKDPEKGLVEDNLDGHAGGGEPCPHLEGSKPGEYRCVIHDRPWYPETPCFQHGQIEESEDSPCRIGEWILSNPVDRAHLVSHKSQPERRKP